MKNYHLALLSFFSTTGAFLAPVHYHTVQPSSTQLHDAASSLDQQLEKIAHKLRLQVFDVDTGVYGFESKDPRYGIENIHTQVHMDDNGWLGLTLTEVAHSQLDHRGLVLVSGVDQAAMHDTSNIKVGDVIIGVFVDDDFKISTTGMDYDDTVEIINAAKKYSLDHGYHGRFSLELNRLVQREQVHVQVLDENDKMMELEGLAGDNLRLLLLSRNAALYDSNMPRLDQPTIHGMDCGGEAICGTCLVAVEQGMEHLNKVGPQESSLLRGRPENWRAACKTVIGADNLPGTSLRIRLQPFNMKESKLQP